LVIARSLQIFWNPGMKYFAYGMNTNLDQMQQRCPGAVSLGAAWIDDYEFTFRTHADIEYKPGARCHGVLWEIDDQNLHALDRLEGFPYYYTRFRVRVNTDQYFVHAITYQMNDQSILDHPGSGYLAMVTEGYEQNNVPITQIDHAINRICCSQSEIVLDVPRTQFATTKDCA
jgi:gamma-glutamylcyclotransferase (GGCT)/AIG2-like uncharacterized protein YtfP